MAEINKNLNHSKNIFKSPDNVPIVFFMRPCNERQELKPFIEHGGGRITSKVTQGCLKLAEKGSMVSLDGYISTRFVEECVKQNKWLDPEDFKVQPGTRARSASGDSNNQSFCSSDSMAPAGYIIETSAKDCKGRSKYTMEEDLAIMEYLIEQNMYSKTGGKMVWKDMEMVKVTDHSAQSMSARFRKVIQPNLDKYKYEISSSWISRLSGNLVAKDTKPEYSFEALFNTRKQAVVAEMKKKCDRTNTSSATNMLRHKTNEQRGLLDDFDREELKVVNEKKANTDCSEKGEELRTNDHDTKERNRFDAKADIEVIERRKKAPLQFIQSSDRNTRLSDGSESNDSDVLLPTVQQNKKRKSHSYTLRRSDGGKDVKKRHIDAIKTHDKENEGLSKEKDINEEIEMAIIDSGEETVKRYSLRGRDEEKDIKKRSIDSSAQKEIGVDLSDDKSIEEETEMVKLMTGFDKQKGKYVSSNRVVTRKDTNTGNPEMLEEGQNLKSISLGNNSGESSSECDVIITKTVPGDIESEDDSFDEFLTGFINKKTNNSGKVLQLSPENKKLDNVTKTNVEIKTATIQNDREKSSMNMSVDVRVNDDLVKGKQTERMKKLIPGMKRNRSGKHNINLSVSDKEDNKGDDETGSEKSDGNVTPRNSQGEKESNDSEALGSHRQETMRHNCDVEDLISTCQDIADECKCTRDFVRQVIYKCSGNLERAINWFKFGAHSLDPQPWSDSDDERLEDKMDDQYLVTKYGESDVKCRLLFLEGL